MSGSSKSHTKSRLPDKLDNRRVSHSQKPRDRLGPRKGGAGKHSWGSVEEEVRMYQRSSPAASVEEILATALPRSMHTATEVESAMAAVTLDGSGVGSGARTGSASVTFDEDEPIDAAHVTEYVIGDDVPITGAFAAALNEDLNDRREQFASNLESLINFKALIERLTRRFLRDSDDGGGGDSISPPPATATAGAVVGSAAAAAGVGAVDDSSVMVVADAASVNETEFIAGIVDSEAQQFHNQIPKVLLYTAISVGGSESDGSYSRVFQLLDKLLAERMVSTLQLQSSFRRLFSHTQDLMVVNSKAYEIIVEAAEYCVDKGHLSNEFVKQLENENEFRRNPARVSELKRRVLIILDEFLSSCDLEECMECIREMHVDFYHFEVIKLLISKALDRDNKCRELCSRFIATEVGEPLPLVYESDEPTSELAPHVPKMVIDREAAMQGFTILLQRVEELYKDVPDVLNLLSRFLARAITDEAIAKSYLDNVPLLETDMGYAVIFITREMLNGKFVASRMENIWGCSSEKSIDELKGSIKLLIKEYLIEEDVNETVTVIKEMNVPMFAHELVKQLVVSVADWLPPTTDGPVTDEVRKAKTKLAITLLRTCVANNIFPFSQVSKGLTIVRERLKDYRLDIPRIEEYLGWFEEGLKRDESEKSSAPTAVGSAAGVETEARVLTSPERLGSS